MAGLFEYLNVLVVSDTGREQEAAQLEQRLMSYGCSKCIIISKDKLLGCEDRSKWISKFGDLKINFVVCNDTGFAGYEVVAFDLLVPVIHPDWVSKCIESRKLVKCSNFYVDKRHVLKNAQIYISFGSFSASTRLLYMEMVNALGGTINDAITSKTTHLVTTNAEDPALIAAIANEKSTELVFVFPTWICQCFKEVRLIDSEEHLIDASWSTAVCRDNLEQVWESLKSESEINCKSDVLKGQKFYLGLDLLLDKNLYQFLICLIKWNSGEVIRHMKAEDFNEKKANCYIGYASKGNEFEVASKLALKVGNVAWIFYMWNLRKFVDPKSKILLVPNKLKVFDKTQLTLTFTNYFGQQRYYIQRLTKCLGGKATLELSKRNTHLLFGFPHGKKYITALGWESCAVVNHRWLEGCYLLGKKLDFKLDEYCNDQVNTLMSTSLGQTTELPVTTESLKTDTGELESMLETQEPVSVDELKMPEAPISKKIPAKTPSPKVKEVPLKKLSTPAKEVSEPKSETKELHSTMPSSPIDETDLKLAKMLPEKSTLEPLKTQPTPIKSSKTKAVSKKQDAAAATKDSVLKTSEPLATEVALDSKSTSEADAHQTTESKEKKLSSANTVSNGRAAKRKAAEKLHSDMELLNEFQKNIKRKKIGALLPEELAQLQHAKELEQEALQILSFVVDDSTLAVIENALTNHMARNRLPYNIDALVTGCLEQLSEMDLAILQLLGVRVTRDYDSHTRYNTVIAPKIARTAKFFFALSFQPLKHALVPEFVTQLLASAHSKKRQQLQLDLANYRIEGIDDELLRRTNKHRKTFPRAGIIRVNVSDDVAGGYDVITAILKAHGVEQTRLVRSDTTDFLRNTSDDEQDPSVDYFLVTATKSRRDKFRRSLARSAATGVAVDWDWCAHAMMKLDADLRSEGAHLYN